MRLAKPIYRDALSILLILLFGIIAYSNTFHVPLVYDDVTSIADNPTLRTLSDFFVEGQGYDYNPRRFLPYLTFAVNYHWGGLKVVGYHVFNLAVHLGCAFLIFALVRQTLKTPFIKDREPGRKGGDLSPQTSILNLQPSIIVPLFAALLFAVHPVQTQAVTYIVQRITSLATFFYLLSLLFYIKARFSFENQSAIRAVQEKKPSNPAALNSNLLVRYKPGLLLVGAVCSAILAMRSKEISFTLPFAILLYEAFFFQGAWKRRLLYLAPLLLTLPIIPLSILSAGGHTGELLSDVSQVVRVDYEVPRIHYLFTQFRVLVTYLRLLVLPVNQNLDYDYPIYSTFFTPPVFLSFLLLVAIFVLAVYLYFRTRHSFYSNLNIQPSTFNDPALRLVSFGILWFFLTIAVESSLIPIPDVIFEHRLYLPAAGLCMAAATIFGMFLNRVQTPALARGLMVVATGVIVALTATTWQRNQVWQSSLSLWEDVVAKSPRKARPYLSLSTALGRAGKMEEAIAALSRAVQLQPRDPKPYINLGAALASTGRREEAIEILTQALSIDPGMPDTLNNLGIVLKDVGRIEESIAALSRATQIDPDNSMAWYNLGRTYLKAGRSNEAEKALKQAIRITPDYDKARVELAAALNRDGRYRDAAALLIPELQHLAARPDARLVLGTAAHCLGDETMARREMAALQQLDQRYAKQFEIIMGRSCRPQAGLNMQE